MEKDRREFIGTALCGFSAVGGLGLLYAAKRSWDPLPSIKSGGFTTVDLSQAQENVLNIEKWRGQPVFILKKDKNNKNERDIIINSERFLVVIGLCTHLGCIPNFNNKDNKFICPCHGGEFDISGKNTFGPPPSPLVIPSFSLTNYILVLGEEGEQYKALKIKKLIS